MSWLRNPGSTTSIKNLRDASRYLYTASPHYKRLCDYFALLNCLFFTLVPDRLDISNVDIESYKTQYKKATDFVEIMNIRNTFQRISQVCVREDVFYGYIYQTKDSFYIKQMPSDYCTISSITDGCFSYAFDFSYFRQNQDKLEMYGQDFISKYNLYLQDTTNNRWQEPDDKYQICLKFNESVEYPLIPFSGVFDGIYNIQDYKDLSKAKDEIEIYKAIALKIPLDSDGQLTLPKELLDDYFRALSGILPEEIGAFQTPAEIDSISFDKSGTKEINKIENAQDEFWSAAGVSSNIFTSNTQSSAALTISIQADELISFAFGRQIERNINKILRQQSGKYKFKVIMLDVSQFNKREMHDMYLKDSQSSLPTKSMACATMGMTPNDIISTNWLEENIIGFSNFKPLSSAHTQSGEGGRPLAEDVGETVGDAGTQTREDETNSNR